MFDRRAAILCSVFAAQFVLTQFHRRTELTPPVPALNLFPAELPGWALLGEHPIEADLAAALKADATLSRTYGQRGGSATAELFVAWTQSQLGGQRQLHSPRVCLPGGGWTALSTSTVRIGGTEMRYADVVNAANQATVYYWYETPFHTTPDEWVAKFWLAADGLRYQRTDAALVRVVFMGGQESLAQRRFLEVVQEPLRRLLPHRPGGPASVAGAANPESH
ncbi:exosortase C-terminal domain/associated protein EpsI [Paludibaculum fermentans]|uniref:exosortase C-terminal domain/associated protein EpsI n=1 Tax=Paludibaculum fermentans TaxID=1473598 RepID=UPI003EBE0525